MDPFRLVSPLLGLLEPETAHGLTLWALRHRLAPKAGAAEDPILKSHALGRDFANPVGLAAGFDKNAEVPDAVLSLGFGFVEVGTLTPRPQAGNAPPRVFRLAEDRAVINRLGFNNAGQAAAAARLGGRDRGAGIVGVNIGPNRDSGDEVAEYVAGVRAFQSLADYLVVNISSPNTPGLRDLQDREPLAALLAALGAVRAAAAGEGGRPVPLLVKIAPDLDGEQRRAIAEVVREGGVDGLIVCNTTVRRPPGLRSRHRDQVGGLSGAPLLAPSTALLRDMYRLTEGGLVLIGVGGVASGADAYAKIRAGASLVQLYTALVFQGPGLVGRIKRDLARCLRRDGFGTLGEAVGADLA